MTREGMTVHLIERRPIEPTDTPYPRRWAGLAVLCLALLIIVMANTSLIVAIPDMVRDLSLTSADQQWTIDAYTVPYAALMLVLGALGDRYSRRGGLIVGLLLFGAGSIVGALADSTAAVVIARAIMGVGAATIMPATLSLLVATFPKRERTLAITIWTTTSGLAIALGPLLAGQLLESYPWNSTFLINLPIAAITIGATMVCIPPSKANGPGRSDIVGGLLSIATIAALIYAIIEGPHFGWDTYPIIAAVVAAVGLVAFVLWELRTRTPILDVRLFRIRAFSGSTLAVLLFFLGTFGAIYYISQYLQFVLGLGPLDTGIRLLPLAGAVFVGAALTGRMTPRLGAKVTVPAGMAIGAAGILLMTGLDDGSGYTDFLAPLTMLGLAIGLSVAPCTDAIMGVFPEDELGVGGAANDTAVELGGSLGIAILGSILATSYKTDLTGTVGSQLPHDLHEPVLDSVGGAIKVVQGLAEQGVPQAGPLADAARHSFIEAITQTSLVGAIILTVGTVLVGLILPRHSTPTAPAEPTEANAVGKPEPAGSPAGPGRRHVGTPPAPDGSDRPSRSSRHGREIFAHSSASPRHPRTR